MGDKETIEKQKPASLDDIPGVIKPESLAEKMKDPKQKMAEGVEWQKPEGVGDTPDPDGDNGEQSKPPSSRGKAADLDDQDLDDGPIERDHEHAKENAEILTWLLTLIIAFVVAKWVDGEGKPKEYMFDADQQERIEKGWEIFFRSLKSDIQIPGIIAPLAPMGMAIYEKVDQASDKKAARKKARILDIKSSIDDAAEKSAHPGNAGLSAQLAQIQKERQAIEKLRRDLEKTQNKDDAKTEKKSRKAESSEEQEERAGKMDEPLRGPGSDGGADGPVAVDSDTSIGTSTDSEKPEKPEQPGGGAGGRVEISDKQEKKRDPEHGKPD